MSDYNKRVERLRELDAARGEASESRSTKAKPPQPHGLGVANCPACKQESRFRHLHSTAYGMEETHMAGSERFECAFCGFTVTPSMAADFPSLKFTLDVGTP